ncbi:MAG: ATP-grasp domain-containing protein [Salinivirgaceae bacterium]|nr:ATP-grasp domain-containing protein [Salinivirgaceae bacterium]
MIVLNKPYVSNLLIETANKNNFPVLENDFVEENNLKLNHTISSERATIEYNSHDNPLIYSNSENSINWIAKNLKQTDLPEKINLFKNKVKFRELIQDMYPDFYFKEVELSNIKNIDINTIPKPFVIKPSIGFFSLGVYIINSNEDWKTLPSKIEIEIEDVKDMYPKEVMDTTKFIIEECIVGDEYAIDVYFNNVGEPVVCGIFKHLFASADDTSDRVYYTSKEIIEEKLESFTLFAVEIGKRAHLKNFPMHIEVRVNEKGEINPIEINPMRFGGWCTTADLTTFAFNLNPYECYFNQQKPNWAEILKDKADKKYSMIILDNSTGYETSEIIDFDHEKAKLKFSKILEYRITNFNEYPVFAILFTESNSDNFNEVKNMLTSDLKEFVKVKELTTKNTILIK